jgi:hypothetical protein
MYEWSEEEKKIDFSHNPFSMPNIEPEKFLALDPNDKDMLLSLKAFQYDIVCNGIELSSGAIRNHRPDVMKKAFVIIKPEKHRADHALFLCITKASNNAVRGTVLFDLHHSRSFTRLVRLTESLCNHAVESAANLLEPFADNGELRGCRGQPHCAVAAKE